MEAQIPDSVGNQSDRDFFVTLKGSHDAQVALLDQALTLALIVEDGEPYTAALAAVVSACGGADSVAEQAEMTADELKTAIADEDMTAAIKILAALGLRFTVRPIDDSTAALMQSLTESSAVFAAAPTPEAAASTS